MNFKTTLIAGALFAGLGVALGAFGSHALRPILEEYNRVETFQLAVRYQFYHAFALLFTGLVMKVLPQLKIGFVPIGFILGILFFSGSLYILCFTGTSSMGAIAPIGGTLFLAGWIILLVKFINLKEKA